MRIIGIIFAFVAYLYCSEAQTLIDKIMSPKDSLANSQIAATPDVFEKPVIAADPNATAALPPPPKFSLKAIFEGRALINDKWLKVGDSVNGFTIEAIEKHRALLANEKERKILHIFKGKK